MAGSSHANPKGRAWQPSQIRNTRGLPATIRTVFLAYGGTLKSLACSLKLNMGRLSRSMTRAGPNLVPPGPATRSLWMTWGGWAGSNCSMFRRLDQVTYTRPSGPMVTSPSWAWRSEPLISTGEVQRARVVPQRTALRLEVSRPDDGSTLTSANTTHTTVPDAPLGRTSSHSLSSMWPRGAVATTRRVGQHDVADPPGHEARRAGVVR